MTHEEFTYLTAQGYNRIPIVLELFADLDTPLSIYMKLANRPYSYLLETTSTGEHHGRYSIIGLASSIRLRSSGHHLQVEQEEQIIDYFEGNPLDFVEAFQRRFNVAPIKKLPGFSSGLVGYFSYDTVRHIEKRLDSRGKPDPVGTPDILLLLSEELAIVDNLSSKLYLIVYADPSLTNALANAEARLAELRAGLSRATVAPLCTTCPISPGVNEWDAQAFQASVQASKNYIFQGDIMQVVLAQRMSMPFVADPLNLYRALRSLNPSPYMFFYHFGDFYVVGTSPESLVRREKNSVTVRPLAGTRPRGKTQEEDMAFATDLLTDPKEIAEHIMLVDLGRNDIGRVATPGSVKITDNMVIERYSHVMHLVSAIEGKVKPETSNISILKATFPAGTLSGAPKVRAMEIIDQFEPSKRGIYGGAIGYLNFSGNMDLAITIRTAIIKNGTLYIQSGAGIVADSCPKNEWLETQNKARVLIQAAELAQAGLNS